MAPNITPLEQSVLPVGLGTSGGTAPHRSQLEEGGGWRLHPHLSVDDLAPETQTQGAHSLLGISRGMVNGTSDPVESTLSPPICSSTAVG